MKPPQTPRQLTSDNSNNPFSNNPDNPFNHNTPSKIKVFAPNGSTKEATAWLCIRGHPNYDQLTELFLKHENGTVEVLNKNVVVKNLETGRVCYNPRTCPRFFGDKLFLTGSELTWLMKNPQWPAILELWDNPTDPGSMEGLNPDIGNES